ncbi:ABC transporter permease [Roseomonas sp. BN140053]|uniref:ABC transporter permease n=1 Tax=Roseomonas sp. BN140053 TaxID=3391898 RepID=UPI0039E8020C
MLAPAAVGVLLLILWEGFCRWQQVPVYLFPAPTDIAASLAENWRELLPALWSTLRITLTAFATATIIGTAIAFLFVQSRWIEMSLLPYAVLLQVTPIVAIAPLIIILVKNTPVALVVCATVIAIFPIISNTTLGLRSVDPGLLSYFRMNKVGRRTMLLRLRIPSALPLFLAGLRISSGLALIGAVVAEFVAGTGGRSAGLAYEILQSGFQLDIPRMFAALFLITVSGLILFGIMLGLQQLLLGQWHESTFEGER